MSKKEIMKRNIMILYLSCMACITIGLADFSTNTQTFATESLGASMVVKLSMLRYVVPVLLVFAIPMLQKFRQKYVIIFFELLGSLTYFTMGLLVYLGKLSGILAALILVMAIITEKVLAVIWPELEIELVPMLARHKYYGNSRFILTMFSLIGMGISTVVLKNFEYPFGFGIIFMLSGLISMCFIFSYTFIIDNEIETRKKEYPRFEYKNIIRDLREKDFRTLFCIELFMGIGVAITTIYPLIALTKGYKPYEIALMSIGYMVVYALSDLIMGKIKILFSDILLFSSVIAIISFFALYLNVNMYLVYAILGLAQAGIRIAELDLLGMISETRELEYVSIFSLTELFAAVGLAVISWIMEVHGLNIAVILSMGFVITATFISIKMRQIELKHIEVRQLDSLTETT